MAIIFINNVKWLSFTNSHLATMAIEFFVQLDDSTSFEKDGEITNEIQTKT